MDLDKFLEEYVQQESSLSLSSSSSNASVKSVKDIVSHVVENKITLEAIFQHLKDYMTSKENTKRARSVKFISELIVNLPDDYLNLLETQHLVKFLCSKLEDHYTVSTATLPGLQSLSTQKIDSLYGATTTESDMKNLTEVRVDVIKSLLRDVHVQSMVQADRFIVFNMCRHMLTSAPRNGPSGIELIKDEHYETDFVYGFIQAMDGEKDPRNLLICFECLRIIGKSLNLGPFVEETFEVFSCYFPIDFTPPKSENFVITKQMLIDALRDCFAARKEFAKYALPLLLEKLNSSLEEAQHDALETFTKCAKTCYDPNDYKEFIEPLWKSFQHIAMNATRTNLEYAALEAIRALSSSLSSTLQHFNTDVKTAMIKVSIDSFVEKALDSCSPYLNEPDLKLVWPNVKCLHAVAAGSSTANLLVLRKVVPLLLNHYRSTSFQNQKKTYLDILWQFVSNSLKHDSNPPAILKESVNELMLTCFSNQANKHLRAQSLDGFHHLLSFSKLVELADPEQFKAWSSADNYDAIAKCIWHTLWVGEPADDSEDPERSRIIENFYLIIDKSDQVLSWLFQSLEESIASQKANEKPARNLLIAFEIAQKLSGLVLLNKAGQLSPRNRDLCINILKTFERFFHYLRANLLSSECLFQATQSLVKVIDNLRELGEEETSQLDVILNRLASDIFEMVMFDSRMDYLFKNEAVLARISLVFKAYSLSLKPSEPARAFLDRLIKVFLGDSDAFDPFSTSSTPDQVFKLHVIMQAIGSLDKVAFKTEVEQFYSRIERRLFDLATQTNASLTETEQESVNLLACQFYAMLLNKLENSELIGKKTEELKAILLAEVTKEPMKTDQNEEETADEKRRFRYLTLWIWITKALVLREHASVAYFAGKLVEWLDDSALCRQSSRAFDLILNESFPVMNSKRAANIRLFYRQRFFAHVYPKLRERFESQERREQKPFYMMSVLNMVMHLPKDLVQKQIQSMLPILLYSLSHTNHGDEQLLFSSLKSLELFILEANPQNENEYFIAHLPDIISKLLSMCTYESSLDLRLLGLKCINHLASNLSPNRLIQHQKLVCRQLEKCLSDRKRICRQAAVEARNRWFLLSTKNAADK